MIQSTNLKTSQELKSCEHRTLHFEGKNLRYLVCTCGHRWERFVEYTGHIRMTRFRKVNK